MAKYTDAACRLCRRENDKLFLKGDRCYSNKCAMVRRKGAPGQNQGRKRKESEYGRQLRAKQKTKRFYGVLEGQFRQTYDRAVKMPGITGENLLQLLERRMDNVVYRLGFAESRAQARQLVTHGHFDVNGKRLDIASATLNEGDVISVRENSRKLLPFAELEASSMVPKWLEMSVDKLSGKVVSLPSRDEVDLNVEETLIVELYSK
ncbi:MAG: 30S ribosomal protein S4 [Eubacteriales bacterium]|nr:30S ribosomal protein S4 [Eubacteriales bacterium]